MCVKFISLTSDMKIHFSLLFIIYLSTLYSALILCLCHISALLQQTLIMSHILYLSVSQLIVNSDYAHMSYLCVHNLQQTLITTYIFSHTNALYCCKCVKERKKDVLRIKCCWSRLTDWTDSEEISLLNASLKQTHWGVHH